MPNEQEVHQLLSSAVDGQFGEVLKRVLKNHRSQSWLSIAQAAALADLSVRSLQRRLAVEGLSYSKLVEQARGELAIELIENTHTSVTEIAHELGYSSLPNFSRAFKRWTGKSPSELRRKPSE